MQVSCRMDEPSNLEPHRRVEGGRAHFHRGKGTSVEAATGNKSPAMKPIHASDHDLPLVTILIDTYNYGHLIGRAIESALNQTYPPSRTEILVVDDGSTDNTAEVVQRYGDRIRYIVKTNGGQASAMNEGIRHARGELICLLDADDYFYPDKVALVADLFRSRPEVGLVYNRLDVVDSAGGKIKEDWPTLTWSGDLESRTLLGYGWGCPTSAMSLRKSVLAGLEVPEATFRICPDYFLTSVLPLITHVGVVESSQSTWVFHGGNHGLYNRSFEMEHARLTRHYHAAIRQFAETRLGKHFVTYLGRSGYGTGVEVRGFARLALYLREAREIAQASIEPEIKIQAQLKLAASLLPESLYTRLRQIKDEVMGYLMTRFMRLDRGEHDLKFEAQNAVAAHAIGAIRSIYPARYARKVKSLARFRPGLE